MPKIQIQSNIGIIKVITSKDYFPKSPCKKCGKDIYWIRGLISGKKMPVSIEDGDYIIHTMVCPVVLKYKMLKEQYKKRKENFKFKNRKN